MIENFGGIDCRIAPPWRRITAALIDLLIFGMLVFVPLINFALMLGYGLCRDSWKHFGGQSIGKRILNIRAMNCFSRHDLNEDYSTGITRNLPLFIFGLDLIVAIFSKEGKRIGDRRAQTIVVKDSTELKNYNRNAIRNHKRFVKLYDNYDSHGVHGD